MSVYVRLMLLAIGVVGCTPRMHRGYRATVITGAAVATIVDARMTSWGLSHDPAVMERDVQHGSIHGTAPSDFRLATDIGIGIGAMYAGHQLIERLADRGPESDWVKDVIVTIPIVIEGFCIWNNAKLLGAENWRQW